MAERSSCKAGSELVRSAGRGTSCTTSGNEPVSMSTSAGEEHCRESNRTIAGSAERQGDSNQVCAFPMEHRLVVEA